MTKVKALNTVQEKNMEERKMVNLLGITDLAKRWGYTRQGVHKKMNEDEEFPWPIATINSRTLVFS